MDIESWLAFVNCYVFYGELQLNMEKYEEINVLFYMYI